MAHVVLRRLLCALAGIAAAADTPLLASRSRAPLRQLAQLRANPPELEPIEEEPAISRVVGFVKFDPTAAAHIQKQELLTASALGVLLQAGARYTDLIDPQFVGTLQVDLLWSVARHAR